jgi:hypothetical protein
MILAMFYSQIMSIENTECIQESRLPLFIFIISFSETGFHYLAQVGLELPILLPPSSRLLLNACM